VFKSAPALTDTIPAPLRAIGILIHLVVEDEVLVVAVAAHTAAAVGGLRFGAPGSLGILVPVGVAPGQALAL